MLCILVYGPRLTTFEKPVIIRTTNMERQLVAILILFTYRLNTIDNILAHNVSISADTHYTGLFHRLNAKTETIEVSNKNIHLTIQMWTANVIHVYCWISVSVENVHRHFNGFYWLQIPRVHTYVYVCKILRLNNWLGGLLFFGILSSRTIKSRYKNKTNRI